MSRLFSLASVNGATLTGAKLKATMVALFNALQTMGVTDTTRTTVTASATLTVAQCGILEVDCTSGSVVLTLPTSGTTTDEAEFRVRRTDSSSNLLTVQRGGTDTIEGGTAVVVIGALGQVDFKIPSGKTNWRVVNRGGSTPAAARAQAGVPFRGYIAGLVPSTAGSSATMTFSAGEAADSTNADLLQLASSIGKTTSAWAVGTGSGGLDTGAIANSTAYYFWLIKRVDTGVVDVLISLSATAPTMPANYTLKRLIGWARTNGSAQWLSFKAYEAEGGGLRYIWAAPMTELSSTAVTTARMNTTASGFPADFSVEGSIRVTASSASNPAVLIQSPDEDDAIPNASAAPGATFSLVTGVGQTAEMVKATSAAGLLSARSTAASTTVRIFSLGFTWSRR